MRTSPPLYRETTTRRAFTLIELLAVSKRGFTLIELLVVISIIALLISILLPALSNATRTAQITACSSNLHQTGVGMHAYAADNKDKVAASNYGVGSPYNFAGVGTIWIKGGFANPYPNGVWIGQGILFEEGYVDGGQIFYDPGNENDVNYDNPDIGFRGGTPWLSGNRWMNNNYIQRATIGSQDNGVPNTIADPDSGNGRQLDVTSDSSGASFMICRPDFAFSPDGQQSWVDWTHRKGYNVLYNDSSVEFVGITGVAGQDADPALPNSVSMGIPEYLKASGATTFKYKAKQMEKFFYYKLDRDHPREEPAP